MEELLIRIKEMKLSHRLLIVGVLAVAPSLYMFFEDSKALDDEIAKAEIEKNEEKRKFETARSQRNNIIKLEEQLEFTKNQLREARKRLPDDFRIDEFLDRLAAQASNTSVELLSFKPGKIEDGGNGAHYEKQSVGLELVGRFEEIVSFLDRLVHFETMVNVENIKMKHMKLMEAKASGTAGQGNGAENKASEHETARKLRERTRVSTTVDMIIYRSKPSAFQGLDEPGKKS